MSLLLHQLAKEDALLRLREALHAGARSVLARGVPRSARGAVAAALFHVIERTCLVIVADSDTEDIVSSDAGALIGDDRVLVFPSRDIVAGEDAADVRAERERLAVLEALTKDQPQFIVTTAVALAQPTVPRRLFHNSRFEIRAGEEMDRDLLAGQLIDAGYERVDAVEHVGQFSVRGGIVDVYPPSGEHPYRLEFFGDMIESLRVFEIATQRSRQAVAACLLSTPHEVVLTREVTQPVVQQVLELLESFVSARGADADAAALEAEVTRDLTRLESNSYFPSIEKYLPLLYPERPTLLDHLPPNAIIIAVERRALELHLRRIEEERMQARASRVEEGLELPGGSWMVDYEALLERVARWATVFVTVGDETDEVDIEDESVTEDEPERAAVLA